jgi:hypothetical protein
MSRRQIIVSDQSLRSRRLMQGALVILFLVVAAAMYEFGLYQAGFARQSSLDSQSELQAANDILVTENKRLSEQTAILETAAKIDKEGYRQIEGELAELQSRILAQQEDIEFYKGIVNANDGSGLRIQDFQVIRGLGEREYDLRLVLAQAFRSKSQVSGKVELVVEGKQGGIAARLGLDVLSPEDEQGTRIRYAFRYFQDIKAKVIIPADFIPEQVHVIVHPKGKTSKSVEEFFIWDAKQG